MSTSIKQPTVVANLTGAAEVAFSGERSRPIVAINEDGELVVCCRSTARKYGWEVQGKLYTRTRTGVATKRTVKVDASTGKLAAKGRRATDKDPKTALKEAVKVVDASVEALLAGK